MRNLLKIKNYEVLLMGFALLLLAVLVGCYIWGIARLIADVDRAINGKGENATAAQSFNITDAAKLDLRGLLQ